MVGNQLLLTLGKFPTAHLAIVWSLGRMQFCITRSPCSDMTQILDRRYQLMGKKSSSGYGWSLSKVDIDLERSSKQLEVLLMN